MISEEEETSPLFHFVSTLHVGTQDGRSQLCDKKGIAKKFDSIDGPLFIFFLTL